MREIEIKGINNQREYIILNLLTMDDKWIAVGSFSTGEIQVFDRTSLQLSKVLLSKFTYKLFSHRE